MRANLAFMLGLIGDSISRTIISRINTNSDLIGG